MKSYIYLMFIYKMFKIHIYEASLFFNVIKCSQMFYLKIYGI